MTLYPQLIINALSHVKYPGSQKNIVEDEILADDMRIDGNQVTFSLVLKPRDPFEKSLIRAAEQAILTYVGDFVQIKGNISVTHTLETKVVNVEPLQNVKYKIAIASGKGGVGKSTVTSNLAVSLAKQGYKVGLLDADIFGPSIPKMFNIEDARPCADDDKKIVPIEKYGVKVLSIGFFVDPASAIVWRGAMAGNALKQLINDGAWGELDYFLIDLPPGTSDIHLTIVKELKLDGAIIVSTPQDVAVADAKKGISMFKNDKVNVPILGIVENMSWFTPAELPENKYYIFGKGGTQRLAAEEATEILAQIPIVQGVCDAGDKGAPIALENDTIMSNVYLELANKFIELKQ